MDRIDARRPGGKARRYIQDGAADKDAGPGADRPTTSRASKTAAEAEGVTPPPYPARTGRAWAWRGLERDRRHPRTEPHSSRPAAAPIPPCRPWPRTRAARVGSRVATCLLVARSLQAPRRPDAPARATYYGYGKARGARARARRPACRAGAVRRMGWRARVPRAWACVPSSPGADAGCPVLSRARRRLLQSSRVEGEGMARAPEAWGTDVLATIGRELICRERDGNVRSASALKAWGPCDDLSVVSAHLLLKVFRAHAVHKSS